MHGTRLIFTVIYQHSLREREAALPVFGTRHYLPARLGQTNLATW